MVKMVLSTLGQGLFCMPSIHDLECWSGLLRFLHTKDSFYLRFQDSYKKKCTSWCMLSLEYGSLLVGGDTFQLDNQVGSLRNCLGGNYSI